MAYPDRENHLPRILRAPIRQELDSFGRPVRNADPVEIQEALERARNLPPQSNVFWVDSGKISTYHEPFYNPSERSGGNHRRGKSRKKYD